MKKLFLILLLLSNTIIQAQSYESIFASDSTKWSYLVSEITSTTTNVVYRPVKDTTWNGLPYKLIKTYHLTSGDNNEPWSFFLLREDLDSGKVFYRDVSSLFGCDTTERCIIDFSLQIGDTFHFSGLFPDSLQIVENTYIGFGTRRVVQFKLKSPIAATEPVLFIEGIGCTLGMRNLTGCQNDYIDAYLICNFKNNWQMYYGPYFFGACYPFGIPPFEPTSTNSLSINSQKNVTIFPNPALSTISIDGITEPCSYYISNLHGQRCFYGKLNRSQSNIDISPLSEGFYLITISNGISSSTIKFLKTKS